MKKLRQWWHNTINMLYQWLATILMWISIASNFSHIEWYIKKRAVKADWSATAMAFIVEAGLGLSIHQFISSLRASLLSIGKSISKQDRRFNRWLLPIFGLAAFALAWFSAVCNTEFFGGDSLLGWAAPALTVAFAILEAAKELLSAKRQTVAKKPKPSVRQPETVVRQPQPTVVSVAQLVPELSTKTACVSWLQDNWPLDGVTVSDLKDRWHVSDRTVARYLAAAKEEVA